MAVYFNIKVIRFKGGISLLIKVIRFFVVAIYLVTKGIRFCLEIALFIKVIKI